MITTSQGRYPRWQADPQVSVEGVPSGAAEQEGRRDRRVRNGKLRAPFCNPDRLAPVGLRRGHGHRGYDPNRTQGVEQPQSREQPAPELAEPRQERPGPPRTQPEHLHKNRLCPQGRALRTSRTASEPRDLPTAIPVPSARPTLPNRSPLCLLSWTPGAWRLR